MTAYCDPMPIVRRARYAKNMALVLCPSDGSGFRTRASFLCEAIKGRYSNREKGWIMSPRKMLKVMRAWTIGHLRIREMYEHRELLAECEA